MRETIEIQVYDKKLQDAKPVKVPAKWAICTVCEGGGTDRGANVECDGGGFTSSEWNEQDDDFREGYLRGDYDKPCTTCEGTGKVLVIDRARASKAVIKAYEDDQREEREYQAMCAAERRMGA